MLITQRHCLTETCYILYICLYMHVFVFLCLIYVICFFIIIFFFITIYHIISLTQKNLFFGYVCQKFSLKVLLSFYLIFSQFQLGVAYNDIAHKKSIYRFLSQRNLFFSSHRWISISYLVVFVVSPMENLLLVLTPENFWKFNIFPGEVRSPHRGTETGCFNI